MSTSLDTLRVDFDPTADGFGYLARLGDGSSRIVEARHTKAPRPRLTRDGYTVRAGSPTSVVVRLYGETRPRRLYVWQFSNVGTLFVRVLGHALIVRESDLPSNL